jgi:hypothetical protein
MEKNERIVENFDVNLVKDRPQFEMSDVYLAKLGPVQRLCVRQLDFNAAGKSDWHDYFISKDGKTVKKCLFEELGTADVAARTKALADIFELPANQVQKEVNLKSAEQFGHKVGWGAAGYETEFFLNMNSGTFDAANIAIKDVPVELLMKKDLSTARLTMRQFAALSAGVDKMNEKQSKVGRLNFNSKPVAQIGD